MGKIYSNQPFKFQLSYTTLPAVAASQQILLKNPVSGEVTYVEASIDTENKYIYYYSTTNETFGTPGRWTYWVRITDEFGQVYPSEPIEFSVYTEGEILESVLVTDYDPLRPLRFVRKTLY